MIAVLNSKKEVQVPNSTQCKRICELTIVFLNEMQF